MLLPHLKPGTRFKVVLANSLALMHAGWAKGEAMAIALHTAGYRPPPPSTPTTSSPVVH